LSYLTSVKPEDNPAAPPTGTELVAFDELADPGSRGFSWREGEALFNGFVVREAVFGYVDWCPHAGWPLAVIDHRYLTKDGRIMCSMHGALFEAAGGRCIAGPGQTRDLVPWPVVKGDDGMVRVA
jgi:nitrite reductase/ring-hydroxylating ferredoxin subunit